MNKFLDDVYEGVKAIDFFKEGLGISVELIEEVIREDID